MVIGDGDDDLQPTLSKKTQGRLIHSLVFFFQALATQVGHSASRIRIHQALLVLQRTPVSVQLVEVLLEICFIIIIIAIVAVIV